MSNLIEQGQDLFRSPVTFVKGVVGIEHLPTDGMPEIAFAGRSNVGKSSLINAVTGQGGLARASNTPGRTQEINFFNVSDRFYLVDLPGYGYAAAPEKKVHEWTRLIHDYLRGRVQLRRVFVLIDARHGIKDVDDRIMKMLDGSGVSYQIILTKRDKISAAAADAVMADTVERSKKHVACYPEILMTSSEKKQNIDDVRMAVVRVLEGL